jgi:hypothetical protein
MLNHKRIMSLVLAGAMAASLAVPAFAAETTESTTDKNSTKISATYQAVTISVDVSPTGTVTINPYGLPVSIGKDDNSTDVTVKNEKLVNTAMTIKNKTDIKLDVNATATASIKSGSDMTFSTTALTDSDTGKKAFVYLDVISSSITGTIGTADADGLVNKAYGAAAWTTYSETAKNVLVLNAAKSVSGTALTTLAASSASGTSGIDTYAAGSVAFFRLNGSVVQSPKTAWTTADGFDATIAFTFVPNTST